MTDVRIVTEPLGGSVLSRLLQRAEAPAHWVPGAPASADEWRRAAAERMREADWRERLAALEPAIAATGLAAERLERVRRQGGVVVTTGQQPGLFGGPLYTWSKAASALALADAIQETTGIATAALFWAATDDADFVEASTTVVARAGGVAVLRMPLTPPPGTPMSMAPLGDLHGELRRLREAGGSAADPRPLDAAARAYGDPARTTGDAYVMLLRELLAPLGVPVLEASHPAVRDASAGTIGLALERAREVDAALTARAAEMRAAGQTPQVEEVPGLSLVFAREGTIKRRLALDEAASAKARRGWHTPNVLLRPIVERAILPTVAYVAGPGELAYFAQVSAVAAALGVAAPLAVPRWSCTLIEPHIQELLDRYGVTPADLVPPNLLEGKLARAAMRETSGAAIARVRAAIAGLPQLLAEEAGTLGLDGAVQGAAQNLQHRVDRLERRLVAGIKRRETAQMRDVATLRAALCPRGTRQERLLNPLPSFARHGAALLAELCRAARTHADSLIEPGRAARTAGTL